MNDHAENACTNSEESKDKSDCNEMSRLDTSKLSGLISHLVMDPSSNSKDTKIDFETKLSLF